MVASIPGDTTVDPTEVDGEHVVLDRPWTGARLARRLLGNEGDECTAVVLVGEHNEVLGGGVVARGWAQAARLTTRPIVDMAHRHGASGLLLVRNRLDRDTLPYPSEQRVARMLGHAAELAGLRMVDHVIVGHDGSYYSEVEEVAARTR